MNALLFINDNDSDFVAPWCAKQALSAPANGTQRNGIRFLPLFFRCRLTRCLARHTKCANLISNGIKCISSILSHLKCLQCEKGCAKYNCMWRDCIATMINLYVIWFFRLPIISDGKIWKYATTCLPLLSKSQWKLSWTGATAAAAAAAAVDCLLTLEHVFELSNTANLNRFPQRSALSLIMTV